MAEHMMRVSLHWHVSPTLSPVSKLILRQLLRLLQLLERPRGLLGVSIFLNIEIPASFCLSVPNYIVEEHLEGTFVS